MMKRIFLIFALIVSALIVMGQDLTTVTQNVYGSQVKDAINANDVALKAAIGVGSGDTTVALRVDINANTNLNSTQGDSLESHNTRFTAIEGDTAKWNTMLQDSLGWYINEIGSYYFISAEGNDSNDGSYARPWLTVSKVNASSFNPGDQILFNKGDVWRESMTLPSSGDVDNYITIGSYGTGLKPKILGSESLDSWTAHPTRANVWKGDDEMNDPYALTYDANIYFIETDSSVNWGYVKKSGFSDMTEEYDWYWQNDTIYVYSTVDPGTAYARVEVSQREHVISLNNKEYINIDGMDVAYGAFTGIRGLYPPSNLNGLIIENCHVHHIGIKESSGGYGIEAWYDDMIIRNDSIHDCGRRSISVQTYSAATSIDRVDIYDNVLYNGFHTTGVDVGSDGAGTISNLHIYGNYIYDTITQYMDGVENIDSEGIYIDERSTGQITGVCIYNNIIKDATKTAITFYDATGGIYNNTVYGTALGNPNEYIGLVTIGGSAKAEFKNNIVYNNMTSDSTTFLLCLYEATSDSLGSDYNLLYNTDTDVKIVHVNSGDTYYTPAEWATYVTNVGRDTNSPTPTDPLLNATTFKLGAASDALDAGTYLNISDDFYKTLRIGIPDIGATEN